MAEKSDAPAPPTPVFPPSRYYTSGASRSQPAATDPHPLHRTASTPHPPHPPHRPNQVTMLRRGNEPTTAFKTFDSFEDSEAHWPGWHPGSEPGFDPAKSDGGHGSLMALNAPCDIAVVDFSQEDILIRHFDNAGFIAFLEEPEPAWAKCRWINVNGVSWDVIQAVGSRKNLHKLAIEDIMNTMNRTKCDWYPNHAFIVLTLQKLVHLSDPDAHSDSDSDSSDSEVEGTGGNSAASTTSKVSKPLKAATAVLDWLRRGGRSRGPTMTTTATTGGGLPRAPSKHGPGPPPHALAAGGKSPYLLDAHSVPRLVPMRSLQRYRTSPNETRSGFMEKNSPLAPRGLAVSAEQVSIFLHSDNTVISFFELSAEDIERPIVKRLSTPGTVLRQSCDASMVVQAIIDALIDLAVPVSSIYNDVIGDLELDVLTSPSIRQSRRLYITISEINKMLSFLKPIDNLLSVMRDHRTDLSQEAAARVLQNDGTGVIVTPMAYLYLGDVLDQCLVVTEALLQNKQAADNLIDLIFNTISAAQNESMKQLTTATIVFLPLTFLTGYFGMNFDPFYQLEKGTPFFWILAVPTALATIVVLMRNIIWTWATEFVLRHRLLSARRKKAKKMDERKRAARRRRKAAEAGHVA